ncbi:MAG: hypothetical protein ACTSQI_02490 [Candidatus Helarchaeota archaeon]
MANSQEESAKGIAEGLSDERKMLLYLIGLYSKLNGEYGKQWLKDLSLKGLISKGIRDGIFDWDYAPSSIMYRGSRKVINISQEGTNDLNYLRTVDLVSRLRLGTNRHFYFNAFSVTMEGAKLIKTFSKELRDKIDKLVHCQRCGKLYEVIPIDPEEVDDWADYEEINLPSSGEWDSSKGGIFMVCHDCKIKINTRLDWIEDVSYKCVPKWLKVRMVTKCTEETCKE